MNTFSYLCIEDRKRFGNAKFGKTSFSALSLLSPFTFFVKILHIVSSVINPQL